MCSVICSNKIHSRLLEYSFEDVNLMLHNFQVYDPSLIVIIVHCCYLLTIWNIYEYYVVVHLVDFYDFSRNGTKPAI